MAACNSFEGLKVEIVRIPSDPSQLPSLGSDEESFVVLWKDVDNKHLDEDFEPIGDSVVEEAKQLINKELCQMEKLTISESTTRSLQTNEVTKETEKKLSKEAQSIPQLDQTSILPEMPQAQRREGTVEMINSASLSSDLASEGVQGKIRQIMDENIRLKDIIRQNNSIMKSQYDSFVAWQEDVRKVHLAYREKVIDAKNIIEKFKAENYNLTCALEKVSEIKSLLEEEVLTLKSALKDKERQTNEKLQQTTNENIKEFDLDIANKKIKELELSLKHITLENSNLKQDKGKDISTINDYEKEIEKLRQALYASKQLIEEKNMELAKKGLEEKDKESLNEVIESLRNQLMISAHNQSMLPSPEEVINIRQQLASTQIMLTQMQQSRAAAYAQIEARNREIAELKRLQTTESQKDEMFALQTQLEVFKTDFEAERDAKETIKGENDRLSVDIQNLQRRNQQLQEEIEVLRDHDCVVLPSHSRDRARRDVGSESSSNEHPLKCPKCSFGFKTQQALVNHVYRCIELDDHLP